MEHVEIYKKLRQLRKERGLTLNTFAEKIGSDYQQLSRIERGKSKLSIDMLMKMANALEAPVSDLMEQTPSETKVITAVPLSKEASHLFFNEEMLTVILEKLELGIEKSTPPLRAPIKAALASQIYKQALQFYREKNKVEDAEKFIDFSVGLIKTALA